MVAGRWACPDAFDPEHAICRCQPMSAEPCKKEDIRSGDVTADLISEAQTGRALLMTREAMILSGLPYATETFAQVDPEVVITWLVNEGDAINANSQLAIFEGPARALLTARQLLPSVKVQVEVETFEEFDEALAAQLDIILLNNFDTQAL